MKIKTLLAALTAVLAINISLSAETPDLLPLENLGVPKSLGRVESKFKAPNSARWVIHIQDVHAQLTAQQNIDALVTNLNELYGISAVALEGGWSTTSLPESWAIPSSSRGKQRLAQILLEEDYITGPVHAALFSKTPVTLVGIEDQKLYEENRQLYLNFLDSRESTMGKIAHIERQLNEEKGNMYNPSLLEFDKKLSAFRDGKKSEEFIPYALKLAADKKIDLSDLAALNDFEKALKTEKSIDREKLKAETERLIKEFKHLRLSLEELLLSGKIPAEKLEYYPQAALYLQTMRTQEKIPHRALIEQIETLISRLKEKLGQTSDEKELMHRALAFETAKKIMTLQATNEDLKNYQTYRAPLSTDMEKKDLTAALENGLKFYALAKQRDQIFFDKINTDPKLSGNIAVVAGGFHTEGLVEKFEQAGISYAVITPDLGEKPEPVNEKLYLERLRAGASSQTLSEQNNFYGVWPDGTAFDKAFKTIEPRAADPREAASRLIDGVLSFRAATGPADPVGPARKEDSSAAFSDEDLEAALNPAAAKKKVVIVVEEKPLIDLLGDPNSLASQVWRDTILPNSAITVVLINDPEVVFTNTEGKAKFLPAQGTLEAVAARQKDKHGRVGVLSSSAGSMNKPDIVALDLSAETLALIRPLLETNRVFSAPQIEDMISRMKVILQRLFTEKASQTSA